MKTMNRILALLALVPVLAVSCRQKEAPYQPGETEKSDCYGVYFPTQDIPSELDPAAPLELTIKVNRTVASGDITVPIVVTQDEEMFKFDELRFENGEEETVLKVSFPGMTEVGKTYSCTVAIEDPSYAKLYGTTATDIAFSVTRVKWDDVEGTDPETGEKVTLATFFDDAINFAYSTGIPEIHVPIQVHSQIPGYYRLVYPYGEAYPYNDPGDWDDSKTYYLYIHAEDPDFVWIPQQDLGMTWGYGMFKLWSESGYSIEKEGKTLEEAKALGMGGRMENGVITFPKKAILVSAAALSSWYYGNNNGQFKVILPGCVDADYSWSVKQSGMSSEGSLPVDFTLGSDIASIKYKTFEGSVTGEDLDAALQEVLADDSLPKVTETSTMDLSFEKTGVYTLLAVASDKQGGRRGSTSIVLYYLADGDEIPVKVSARLQPISLEDRAEGVSAETNLSFMIKGEELTDVKCAAFKRSEMGDEEAVLDFLMEEPSLSDKDLKNVNGNGLVGTISSLVPGTDFILVVYASNGYEETVVKSEYARTDGDPLPIYMDYSVNDLKEDYLVTDASKWDGTAWNYYATDMFGSLGIREYIGKVTMKVNPGEPVNAQYGTSILVSGLFGDQSSAKQYGYDTGECVWEMDADEGILYVCSKTTVDGKSAVKIYAKSDGKLYNATYCNAFIPVAKGYFAFVDVSDYGFGLSGILNQDTQDGYSWKAYLDPLLVDPAEDDNGVVPASVQRNIASLRERMNNLNSVETLEAQVHRIAEIVAGANSVRSHGTLVQNDHLHFGLKAVNAKATVRKSFEKKSVSLGEQRIF